MDPFREPRMFSLEALESLAAGGEPALEATLLPLAAGLAGFPRVELDAAQAARFTLGQRLRGPWPAADPAAPRRWSCSRSTI